MKQINKRTCIWWGTFAVMLLVIITLTDELTFGNVTSDKKAAVTAEADLEKAAARENTAELTIEAINIPIVTATAEAVTTEAVTAEAVSPWANKAIANVENQANVRTQPNQEAELAGKIQRGDEADVVEMGPEWTLITSGNVSGYVKNEFLVYGAEAESLANQLGKKVATVQTAGLNVRKQPSQEAEIYEQADAGKEYIYTAIENGWVAVTLSSGETGYVNEQYVTTELKLGKAITMEEEQAAIRAQQEAKEKAAKEKAEKEAKKKAASTVTKTTTKAVEANVDDLTLLAAIIEIEAGTNYEGGVAVGNVVLNRVNSSKFPNTISGVIYQRGQFPGAHNGKLAKVLARGPKSACVQAAQAALNGENYVGGRLYFNSQRSVNYNKIKDYVLIGGNCFY